MKMNTFKALILTIKQVYKDFYTIEEFSDIKRVIINMFTNFEMYKAFGDDKK